MEKNKINTQINNNIFFAILHSGTRIERRHKCNNLLGEYLSEAT